MRKAMVWPTAVGVVVAVGAGVGLLSSGPAFGSAVLDGFSINTQDKAVTVTLYTDQRASYTTENHGKQFAIILPDAKLSPEQINSGLPVVIDNQNRFIGRAVPTEDGRVKIILPNLPASEYSVSVQQKRPGSPVMAQTPSPAAVIAAKPRPAISPAKDNTFEEIAAAVSKPVPKEAKPAVEKPRRPNSSTQSSLRLSTPPAVSTASAPKGQIWNPYLVNMTPKPVQAAAEAEDSTRWTPRPVRTHRIATARSTRPARSIRPIRNIPLNTMAVAEPQPVNPAPAVPANVEIPGIKLSSPDSVPNLKDPLWYLHSLPPADSAAMPADNLSGLAKDTALAPAGEAVNMAAQAEESASQPQKSAFSEFKSELKAAILGLPLWFWITAALFLGGIGIFALMGGLVLLRLLFTQARHGQIMPISAQSLMQPGMQPAFFMSGYVPGHPMAASGIEAAPQPGSVVPGPSVSAEVVSPQPKKVNFEDKAAVNALDYLKRTPQDVASAVHNAVLIKFPSHRNRAAARRRAGSPRPMVGFSG